jgi:Tfp pilus assembly protein FimT
MVVVVLLSIIASIAFPSFSDLRDRNRIRAATEAVLFHLQFARSESIKQNRDLYLSVQEANADSSWCIGIGNAPPASPACDCNVANACRFGPTAASIEQSLRSADFPDVALETTHENIIFDSRRGSVPAIPNGGAITLTGTSGRYVTEIRFNITGRPLVCGNLSGYPSC